MLNPMAIAALANRRNPYIHEALGRKAMQKTSGPNNVTTGTIKSTNANAAAFAAKETPSTL